MGQGASTEGRRLAFAIRRQDAHEVFRVSFFFIHGPPYDYYSLVRGAEHITISLF